MEKIRTFEIKLAIKVIGYISTIISSLLLLVLITQWEIDEPNEAYWVIGMFVFYLIGGIYIITISLKYRIIISKDKLVQTYAFKETVAFEWNDIERINIRITDGLISIHGKERQIKLTRSISNIAEIFNIVLEKSRKEKITFDS